MGPHHVESRRNGRARALAIADNRVAELDLDWDPEVLKHHEAQGFDLSGFWTPEEFATLFAKPTAGLTDENTVVERAATDIVRGDLFALWPHRLCGNATLAEDVTRLLDDATPRR